MGQTARWADNLLPCPAMNRSRSHFVPASLLCCALLSTGWAHAFPGVLVGKGDEKRAVPATHVVIMTKGEYSAVTVLPEYAGPLTPFALVLAVPGDVTPDRIKSMKREFIDRVENITAPRFHEWWEQDPCDQGPTEQEWERDLRVSGGGFLNPDAPTASATKKVAREMYLRIDPIFMEKESEYTCNLLSVQEAGDVSSYLSGKGYKVPPAVSSGLQRYVKSGMNLVACDVDTSKVALVAGDRAQLAGIRYWSEHPVRKVPSMLGLANLDQKQDLFVYVIDPEHRYEVKNYKNIFPPTNIEVDYVVKERPSEFYNAIHDMLLAKHPDAFLAEFAWSAQGCGQPCPNEPLLIHELMSLGGDILDEKTVPEAERFPEPPEETEEEKEAFKEELKEMKPKERKEAKKQREDERKELARRKALLARQQWVLSRMHYRYDAATLTRDPEIGPAKHVQGGIWNPKGVPAALPQWVKDDKAVSKFQVRFTHFFPWRSKETACDKPVRGRWGKRWREVKIWNHIWVADALSRKRRNEIKPAEVVRTPIAELGLPGKAAEVADAGPDGGKPGETKPGKGCSCALPGDASGHRSWWLLGALWLPIIRRKHPGRRPPPG
jgi:hypothetical protein